MNTTTTRRLILALIVSWSFVVSVVASAETHVATEVAKHMEIKDPNNSNAIVCSAYGAPDNTRPVAENCPLGTFIQQLFDSQWQPVGHPINQTITISSTTAAVCDDPTVSGAQISFGDADCYYKLQDLTAQNYGVCEGWGDTIAGCGLLAHNHQYKVQRWLNDPWRSASDYAFTASISGNDTAAVCDDPTVSGAQISFGDADCYYKLQDLTAQNYGVCEGWGDTIAGCGLLAHNHQYKVQRWLNDPWRSASDYTFTAHGPGNDDDDSTSVPVDPVVLARNNHDAFFNFQDIASSNLNFYDSLLTVDEGVDPAGTYDGHPWDSGPGDATGAPGDGNFRVKCQWSHFAKDDPIIKPNNPNHSHLHMFFGNTRTDAFTNTDASNPNIATSGGGSCSGFALNRSAYWVPALLDANDNAIVPKEIVIYYKTKTVCKDPGAVPPACTHLRNGNVWISDPTKRGVSHTAQDVEEMPQGLQLVSGNHFDVNLNELSEGETSQHLFWSCGPNDGTPDNKSNQIPDCGHGNLLNATIYFPQCWNGNLREDNNTHVKQVEVWEPCPDETHDRRLPQLGVLIYWDLKDVNYSIEGLRLSSDKRAEINDPNSNADPGGTLHGDWIAGWHNGTMTTWVNECLRKSRNCTVGQTSTQFSLKDIDGQQNNYRGHPEDSYGFSAGSYLVEMPDWATE